MARAELTRYAFAAAVTFLALLVTLALARLLDDVPFLLLLAAVMASALRGGTGPGLLATAMATLSVLGGSYERGTPLDLPFSPPWSEVVRLTTFLGVASGISFIAGARRRVENERDALLVRERAARADAEAANRAKDEFLATVSHELRNPLAPILAWASLLRRGVLDTVRQRAAVDAIERNAKLQARLIDDLLDVSRIVAGRLRLDAKPLDLEPLVTAAVEGARPAADAKRIDLDVQAEEGIGRVSGDAERLQQVVSNLLSNAVKFTPEGGRISVRLRRVDDRVELRVRDTGCGIDPRLLPHVFDRFWQGDGATGRWTSGLGLGLAIVRHLVALHGGTVSAHSRGWDRGATFRVMLPLGAPGRHPVVEGERPAGGPPPSRPVLDGIAVLVVDDEPDAAGALSALLASCGAQVRVARSTAEALGMLDEWTPSVVVSDIKMPGEDGYTLLRKLRARGAGRGGAVPAVALTAYARAEDRTRALAAGFQVHVGKAGDPMELVGVIAGLVHRGAVRVGHGDDA